jgi:hypothetical protein
VFKNKDISMKKVNSSKVCLVCGSGPTNNNYGAFTCSPCKVFFHRNVHMDLVSYQNIFYFI